jgi:IMP cyclohydrolase
VVPTDGAVDDPLRHYCGVIAKGTLLVAGNGRQVSDIAASGSGPATAQDEFNRFTYEPDSLFTPRLSAVVDLSATPFAALGIASRGSAGETKHQQVLVYNLVPGDAWVMHTYDGNVDAPDARGFMVHLPGDGHSTLGTADIWDALHPQYRVAIGSVTINGDGNWADGECVTVHRE